MNKKKLLVLFMAAATLGACTTEEDPGETEALDPIEEEAALEEEPDEAVVTEEELAPVSDSDMEAAEMIEDIEQYEEFEDQDVFDPTGYDARLITDNGSTRVILFSEGEEQMFKSIFIEEESRLKIIDLKNNELLLNSPL